MKLIADGGATKIQWMVIDEKNTQGPIETAGFNPYIMAPKILEDIVDKELVPVIKTEAILEVYYYGAGCSTVHKCSIVEDALKGVFRRADCEIYHDLLGAARALLGRESGIACILGTGSNSCLYDGKDIVENVTSLGYFLGDEGSGAYLGKILLTDYLRKRMPGNIVEAFEKRYRYTVENILDALYNKSHPNQFLSSFAPFLSEHQKDDYIRDLVVQNFTAFMDQQVTQYTAYKEQPLGTVGSVGFYFSDIFASVARQYGLTVNTVIQSPIEGLVKFHQPEK